jgi:hypothetical protein
MKKGGRVAALLLVGTKRCLVFAAMIIAVVISVVVSEVE